MKKILTIIFACSLAFPALADDATHIVGTSPDAEYPTISSALAASNPGDLITLENGTYPENLTIASGESVTIMGNVDNPDSTKIAGKILIESGATAQIEYVNINASGQDYGVKIQGNGVIQHGTIQRGDYGVVVSKTGIVEIYDETIKYADVDGVNVHKGGKLDLSYSWIRHNNKAGIRAKTSKRIRITDSTIRSNHTGIFFINAANSSNDILRNEIKNNTTGIHLKDSKAYRSDNRFNDNTNNLVVD